MNGSLRESMRVHRVPSCTVTYAIIPCPYMTALEHSRYDLSPMRALPREVLSQRGLVEILHVNLALLRGEYFTALKIPYNGEPTTETYA